MQGDGNNDGNGSAMAMAGRRMGRAPAQQGDGVAGQGRATQIDAEQNRVTARRWRLMAADGG